MKDKMQNCCRRLGFACVMAVVFAGAAGAVRVSRPTNDGSRTTNHNYERVKLYLGPLNSDQWQWGWAPKAVRSGKDSGGWQPWGSLPFGGPFADGQASADSRYQYLIGGYSGVQLTGLYRNDLTSRNWTTLAPMPLGISDGAAAVIGDTLYVHGGYSYTTRQLVNRLYKYCISTNSWTWDTGCCPYNWEPRMVALDGKLFYMGGCRIPGADSPSVQTWCYTPGSASPWTRKADMHTGRVFAHACSYDGRIYMAGGTMSDVNGIRETEFYDPGTDAWTQDSNLFPYLPASRWAGASGYAGNRMFIYDGTTRIGDEVRSAFEYDFVTRKWDSVPRMTESRVVYREPGTGNGLGEGVVLGINDTIDPSIRVVYKPFVVSHDVGATEIVAPASDVDSGNIVTPTAWVKNFGEQPEGFRVLFRIDDNYTRYDSVSLQPGESAQVSFPSWVGVRRGQHVATCSTMLARDENHANDARTKTFTIGVMDVDVIVIMPRTVDSGDVIVPVAIAYNNGTTPVGFWTMLRIQPDYYDAETAYVLPGGNTNLTFGAWTATHRGRWEAGCSVLVRPARPARVETVFVRVRDAGIDQIFWPVGDYVGEGLNEPRALAHNYGNTSETIPARFEIYDSTGSMVYRAESRIGLAPGVSDRVDFSVWAAVRGSYRSKVYSMLSGDLNPANDTVFGQFSVESLVVDIGITSIYPRDTIPPGPVSPWVGVRNYGQGIVHLQGLLSIQKDDTLPVFSDSQVAPPLPPGGEVHLSFGPWQATSGRYLFFFTIWSDSESVFDTLSRHVFVTSEAIEESSSAGLLPKVFALDAPWPSPCRGTATICYALPRPAIVSLKLYDVSGRLALVLDQGWRTAGRHTVAIRNPQSAICNAQGVFICRFTAGDFTETRKLLFTER